LTTTKANGVIQPAAAPASRAPPESDLDKLRLPIENFGNAFDHSKGCGRKDIQRLLRVLADAKVAVTL